ncbi:MAG: hypothetical protein Q8918_17825, partial [Bacteroidota bacterium]|nr:hypothetical protein [Bacteroidota bacterium]
MKKYRRKILANQGKPVMLFFLCMFLMGLCAHSQTGEVGAVIRNVFSNYRSSYVHEKIYVHTDKNFYLPGEILWFRVYDVDASFHRPLSISKLVYVELLDKTNKPVLQEKISLKPGEANGSFVIPAGILSGDYRFRAYTRWMRNFSADYFFEKAIRILNPEKPVTDSMAAVPDRYDIQFFPEGGNLVEHLESKLGFRVTDVNGRGRSFEGILTDDRGDTLLKFHPLHLGLGHFSFTPSGGRRYKAILRFPDGRQLSRELPVAFPAGYVMSLSRESNERLTVTVRVSGNQESGRVFLLVHTRGSLKKLEGSELENGKAVFAIETKALGDGISQFTVFNHDGKPVCERLYFKYPEKELKIEANAGQSEFSTRKEIQLDLSSTDREDRPVPADMSLAVYRVDSLQQTDGSDISHYLYLTSDLGSGIESPDSYFSKGGDEEEAMDNLMLTRGWRRFKWDEIIKNQPVKIEYAPEGNGHILEGKLLDNKSGAPVRQVEAYLSVPSARTQFRTNMSDSNGRVRFELDDFYR